MMEKNVSQKIAHLHCDLRVWREHDSRLNTLSTEFRKNILRGLTKCITCSKCIFISMCVAIFTYKQDRLISDFVTYSIFPCIR